MMPFKKTSTIVLTISASAVMALGFLSNIFTKKTVDMIAFPKNSSYNQLWKKVDSCEQQGLSSTALEMVQQIYAKSKAEKNAPQFVKAVIHRMKFESYREEFSLEKSIIKLQNETKEASYPVKPVLQSILADAFWQYFQNNRWKFYNRTTTVHFKNDDIETWDLKTIQYAVISNYKASLENTDSLKRTNVDLYDDILTKGTKECRAWRPTLYDFLGHRALSFFMDAEPDVTRPADHFTVNQEVFLKPYVDFASASISTPSDSLDTKYSALQLMQNLTKFHQHDKNPDALIDIELLRLDYVQNHSQHPKKDTLYFNSLQALQTLFLKKERSTEIDFRMANWYLQKSNEYKPLEGDQYKWYKKRAKEICEAAIRRFPHSYGAKQCLGLIQSITTKSFHLTIEEVNEPRKPFRALVTSQNVNNIYFKIVKTSGQELRQLFRKNDGKSLYETIKTFPLVKTFRQELTDDGDFQTHQTEIKMPELPTGYYVILSSLTADFKYSNNISAYTTCIISDITSIERRNQDGSYDIYALHRQTGEPLKNITAQVWYETYDYGSRNYQTIKGSTLKTDDKGFVNINSSKAGDQSFFIEFTNGNDVYYNANNYHTYAPYESNDKQINSFIYTDRSIYRPGQTVFFKAIVMESVNGKHHVLKAKHPVVMTFYDVNYQKISSLNLTTNEFGTVSGAFIAPQNGLNGQMQLTDGYGSVSIAVEDYKRPKFEAKFNPIKGSYKLNELVTLTGNAKAYAGNAIDGAVVKYRIVRKTNYPYWYWWCRPPAQGNSDVILENGETTTNDTGAYIIKFKALADESVSKTSYATFNYEIYADVTDINGETHSAQCNVVVGYQALQLSVSSDQEIMDAYHPKTIRILSTNLSGTAEPAKGTYTIYQLKQPQKTFRDRLWPQPDRHSLSREDFYKTFPHDLYADENNTYTWEKEAKVFEKSFDTGTKTEYDLSAEIRSFKAGTYVIEAYCKDSFGEEVKALSYITVFHKNSEEPPLQTADWFYIHKTTAEPDDTLRFIHASAYKASHYLYEVEHQHQITDSKLMPLNMKEVLVNVEEKHRGNFALHTTFVKHNRLYNHSQVITVPYTNKELDIEFETFRNKLLPGQPETWKLIVKDKKGEKAVAELLAGMYDASLDAFAPHQWYFSIYQQYYASLYWTSSSAQQTNSTLLYELPQYYPSVPNRYYDQLNYFGLGFYSHYYQRDFFAYDRSGSPVMAESAMTNESDKAKNAAGVTELSVKQPLVETSNAKAGSLGQKTANVSEKNQEQKGNTSNTQTTEALNAIKARSNFNETAFFFPQLQTNDKGEISIQFTVPESLTMWKFKGLAHTKDLKYAQFEKEVITQKEFMVQPHAPRFFREGDQQTLISKIVNLSDKALSGNTELKLYDALTNKDISALVITSNAIKSFTVAKGQSVATDWNVQIPEGYFAITYKVVAKAGLYTDGEEMAIPVLTNRMLVTESMPMSIRSKQTKEFNFTKFVAQNNHSTTLKNHSYTLEFTANPAWYAVQALPYLMEYPYECAEQTFARYYSNTLATHVVNAKPKTKQIFEAWKNLSPEAFLSNLSKNQELKSLVLEETPWVLDSKNESENKKRVGLLFDLTKMAYEQSQAFKKLQQKQSTNGGFVWFDGGPDDWYMTQHIVTGFAHLDRLGAIKVRENNEVWNMVAKAVNYCDERMREEYESLKRYNPNYKTENNLSYTAIQYLYMRSHFKDIELRPLHQEQVNYYQKQAQSYWLKNSRYMQAMIALSLHQYNDQKTPKDILKSLKENSINSEEMGVYWKENYGYFWYEAPIEMQALMIEAFDEITHDEKAVDDLKTWLIKSKQTQHWGTTRATTEAVYALLLKGADWLETESNVDITVGNTKLDPKQDPTVKPEPGTGYVKKVWNGADIKPNTMGNINIKKKDVGVSYGAVYWQYFEQLDKITPHETPLNIKKQLFLQKNTAASQVLEPITTTTKLHLGDKLTVRIELRVDRNMSYVHMKDMRASGFEPTNVLSTYKYQDGLGYYESTRDAATHFFFSYLNKGTYVFEYPLLVNHYGNFSNGITTVQCMYAPEFTSHSEGIRVSVVK